LSEGEEGLMIFVQILMAAVLFMLYLLLVNFGMISDLQGKHAYIKVAIAIVLIGSYVAKKLIKSD
jgi:hypothetical protein